MKKKHNGLISVWKFMFALLIMCHHASYINVVSGGGASQRLFGCGSIGVDFFFLVSGYLLSKKVFSEERAKYKRPIYKSTWDFILNKIKTFYPYLLFSFITITIVISHIGKLTFSSFVSKTVDLTLLMLAGLKPNVMVNGAWYLSAMILAMLIVYPLHKKYQKTFSCLIAPLIGIFLGGYLFHNVSGRAYTVYVNFMYFGLGKAIFELCLGCVTYELCELFKKIKFTNIGKLMLSITCFSAFSCVIILNSLPIDVRMFDWLFVIVLMIGLIIAFSEKTLFYEKTNNKLFYYLESLSLPFYLNNYIMIHLVKWEPFFASWSFTNKFVFAIICNLIISIIEIWFIDFIKDKISPKVKRFVNKYIVISSK